MLRFVLASFFAVFILVATACGGTQSKTPSATSVATGVSYNCDAPDEQLFQNASSVSFVLLDKYGTFGSIVSYGFAACLKGQDLAVLNADMRVVLDKINREVGNKKFANTQEFDSWFGSSLRSYAHGTNPVLEQSLWDNAGYGGYLILLQFDHGKPAGPGFN